MFSILSIHTAASQRVTHGQNIGEPQAFDAYADNPAHKEFEFEYLPVRDRRTTHDITN